MLRRLPILIVLVVGMLAGVSQLAELTADEHVKHSAAQASLARISEKLKTGEPLVFATFGDSITWPCFHTDFRQNYMTFAVAALKQAYPHANVKVVHAGNMGDTGRGIAEKRFERYVLVHRPDLVVIMFGMNDCLGGAGSLDTYDQNLTRLIRLTRDSGALPIIASQNEIIYDSPDGQLRGTLPLYMGRAMQVAAREQTPAADCFALWKPLVAERAELASRLNDWIHPNHAGHRLMATAILQAIAPQAVPFVSVEPRTPPRSGAAVACLLPGPPGKQILQMQDVTWIALSGGTRNGELTELVFSYSRQRQPAWHDFHHLTLVGACPEAVFDALDRKLTAGLLLDDGAQLLVVFSWNVGVFWLSIDLSTPAWERTARDPQTWLKKTDEPFVRPIMVVNHQRGAGLLHDGYLQPDGWPAVFCAARQFAPGAGWEITDGEDGIALVTRPHRKHEPVHELRFPNHHSVRCTIAADKSVYWAAASKQGELSQLGKVGSPAAISTQISVRQWFMPSAVIADQGWATLLRPADDAGNSQWVKLEWQQKFTLQELPRPTSATREQLVPLPWSDGKQQGIKWHEFARDQGVLPAFAYQSRLPENSKLLGLLVQAEAGLVFQSLSLDLTTPAHKP